MAQEIKKVNGVYMGSQEIASTALAGDANKRAYYKFDAGALTTDSSGNGYTLTNTNTVGEGTGKFGVCADFSSTNSNKDLRIANDLGIAGGAISLSAWVKITTAPISTNIACIIAQSDAGTDTEYYIRYYNNGGTLQVEFFRTKRGVGNNIVTVNHTLSTTSFTHVALTYDATNIVGYINGVNVGTIAASGNGTSGSSDCFSLGEVLGFNTWYLSGLIDDAAVFNRALTATEISNLYKTGVKKLNGQVNLNPELESTSLRGDANLVQYTRFEGNSTATVGGNGTDANMSYTTGKFGQCGVFNGSNAYISISRTPVADNQSGTISAWINITDTAALGRIVSSGDEASATRYIDFYVGTTLYYRFNDNGTEDRISGSTTISTGQWYHVVITSDGSAIKMYVNGNLETLTVASGTNTGRWFGDLASADNLTIGVTKRNTLAAYFPGNIDDLAIFSRALTATEISNLYNTNIKKYMGVSNV
jgi:hypothetical protein